MRLPTEGIPKIKLRIMSSCNKAPYNKAPYKVSIIKPCSKASYIRRLSIIKPLMIRLPVRLPIIRLIIRLPTIRLH